MRRPFHAFLFVLPVVAVRAIGGEGEALAADETHACIVASDEGQKLRDDGKLVGARDRFVRCARDACPGPVRSACAQGRAEIEPRVPTVVFAARDAGGHDLVRVRVSVDGAVVLESITGAGVPIDPGPHAVRFEADGAVAQETIVAREGEKDRVVAAALAAPSARAPSATPPAPTTPPAPAPTPARTPASPPSPAEVVSPAIPTGAWVVGAVGVVATAGFAYFGLTGSADKRHLSSTCAPAATCSASEVSAARTKLIVADVLLGAAVVSFGVGAYLVLTSSPRSAERARAASLTLDVAPLPGGGMATWRASF